VSAVVEGDIVWKVKDEPADRAFDVQASIARGRREDKYGTDCSKSRLNALTGLQRRVTRCVQLCADCTTAYTHYYYYYYYY